MNRLGTIGIALGLAAVTAAPAIAQEREEFRWQGVVATGRTVEIRGLNGHVEATPASGDRVEVVATKSAKREGDLDRVRVEVVERGEGVVICAVYPGGECGSGGASLGKTKGIDVRIDFEVRVPRGVDLAVRTVNGNVEARSIAGDVDANTVNGQIVVDAAGTVQAHTVNGAIRATSGASRWSGTLDFKTVNGSITVALPSDANAEVEATTVNGGLSTDFPLTIQARRAWGPRRIEGTIGAGGGKLKLATVNGAIRIERT